MAVLNEAKYPGEYIATEANGHRSRDVVTLIEGQDLQAGTVLGVITASGKYTQNTLSGSTGEQVAAAILYGNVDATAADTDAVIVSRDAEVNEQEIIYPASATGSQKTAIKTALATHGIIVRAGSA